MKKEKALELLLWGVVAYAVALLTYFSLKAYDHGVDYISALGSLLSASATFFAAYVAVKLFNDWKITQTGINRSELAKNTLLSFYELVTLCDYYCQRASVYLSLESAKNNPLISPDLIKSNEDIPEVCKNMKEEFKDEYRILRRKFEINLRTYEKVFAVDIIGENVSFEFDNYSFAIAGVLRDLSLSKPVEEIKGLEGFMQTRREAFKARFQDAIVAETSKHINIQAYTK